MNPIFTRRSIREYTNKKVEDELIIQILKAGMTAPSAQNQQSWRFVVIREQSTLRSIMKFHPFTHMLSQAKTAIAVCGDTRDLEERPKKFWVQECSASTQNMLLEIESLGLGGVWVGIYPIEERVNGIKNLLNLPDGVIPLSLVVFGYKGETKLPVDRYSEEKVHWDQWDKKH